MTYKLCTGDDMSSSNKVSGFGSVSKKVMYDDVVRYNEKLKKENDDLFVKMAELEMIKVKHMDLISELENKIIELKEEVKSENYWAREYMRLMLEAREEYKKLRGAYLNTRQTLSNIGLGMLKGEDQIIAMNEVHNIDEALWKYNDI